MRWRQRSAESEQERDAAKCGHGRDALATGRGMATAREGGKPKDRGVALVITLLLLFLMTVIGLIAVLSASSDLLINGYYGRFRGAFYAADSGLNVARQAMYNDLNSNFNTNFSTFISPPPAGVAAAAASVQADILNWYGGAGTPCPINPSTYSTYTSCVLNAGSGQQSWTESFTITNASLQLTPGITNPLPGYSGTEITSYTYYFTYSLTSVGAASVSSVGSAAGSEQSTVTETGSMSVYVAGIPSSYDASFAIFGAFITNYPQCLGPLVPGTMTGTMFTDGAWGFMPGGRYIFTDPVGQYDSTACFFDSNWNSYEATGPSYQAPDGEVIAPNFQDGFSVSQPWINQPSDSYSQMWAAIDGLGMNETPSQPGTAQFHQYLQDVTGAAYPSSGPPANGGVYFNAQTVNGVETMSGGGLYVEGNASITVAPVGTNGELYTITTQGGTVTTMTVNPTTNTTTITSGTNTTVLSGVPINTSVQPSQQGTMIYVDGTINSLSGPGEGQGAINNYQSVTITAAGDVNITGDVRYVTEPVTTTQNQIAGTPVATLIPGNDFNQDLGIFTANGSIILSSSYNDDNLEVDGSQAVIGNNCASWSCGFYVNGCINTFNNVGGQIQTNIFGACMGTENTYYDRRYTSKPGFAPPWFPSTTITTTNASTTTPPTLTLQRMTWLSSSGQ